MIISIASGKGGTGKTTVATNLAVSLETGGTGKTTIATNLAVSLGTGVQLLDCDVEEPNCHLFLNPVIHEKETAYTPVPKIDEAKCTLCRKCVEICRFRAIMVIGKTVLTFPELCHGCGGCMAVCPEKAISETGRELGVVEKGTVDDLHFAHGIIRVGEAMSPPLIRKVRSLTQPETITIIDAPPGTSCPVITAMKGADFVLLVTEPTPFGLHDLRLAVEAVKILKIPAGLVINRCDIGDPGVREYAKQENLPVLMEIPFDRKIAESYSRGKLIVEAMPEWRKNFLKLYRDIEKIVRQGGAN
ncbi:MAG: ATP-binding protein [Desulfamplus sp.]|nr:ATP-binding protein [Desulfamplus sp.]